MKFACLFLAVLSPLVGQYAGPVVIVPLEFGTLNEKKSLGPEGPYVSGYTEYMYTITENGEGVKSFNFQAWSCVVPPPVYDPAGAELLLPPGTLIEKVCTDLGKSAGETLGPIAAELKWFYNYHSKAPHVINYQPRDSVLPGLDRLHLTLEQPGAPLDPQMVFLDGFSNNIVEFDSTTFAMTASVTLPPQGMVFGIRRTATGPENEVWTAHAGTVNAISVCDLGTQNVLATIPTPSLDPNNTVPVGLWSTNDGGTFLYAVSYYTPDSSGNNGALLVFNALTRTLTSTLSLKSAPTVLVMAPDALTAYLLSATGMITYYDVLSGTADLSASTYTPGLNGGYAGAGPVFVHPNGTRLFWNVGPQLEVFDLTTRKITAQFSSGLPSTSAASMRMSQDGASVVFGNGLGNNVILDTLYGNILATFNTTGASLGFIGPHGN